MKKISQLPLTITICVIVAVGAFYGGMVYGKSTVPAGNPNFNGQRNFAGGQGRGNMMRNRGGAVVGQIIKLDDKSVTVKTADGGSKVIYLSDTSSVTKSVEGAKSDLVIGQNIMANGSANTDGSVVAQFVQIRPDNQQPNGQNNQQNDGQSGGGNRRRGNQPSDNQPTPIAK